MKKIGKFLEEKLERAGGLLNIIMLVSIAFYAMFMLKSIFGEQ